MKKIMSVVLLSAVVGGAQAAPEEEPALKIALIGDSTVTDEVGWGKAFADRCKEGVKVENFAAGGRSAKSWIAEGRLPKALASKPDYVLIQFGHNGQPGKGPERETDPETTYRDYLAVYVSECRKIGAKPIIVSSVVRRIFNDDGKIRSSLAPWAKAAGETAKKLGVPFIDLHAASTRYHNELGPEASMAFNPKEGDRTHFNEDGAKAIANLVIEDMKTADPELWKRAIRPSGD